MQKTANYALNKPEGTDVVDIQNFNDNADIIDSQLKKNANDLSTHLADMASQANGKGASMIGVEDSAGHFTGTNVEAVLNELFTSGTNGKNDIYNAISAKGITPASKNFADLVTGISAISTGKRFASGQITLSADAKVTISSLAFTPSLAIISTGDGDKTGKGILQVLMNNEYAAYMDNMYGTSYMGTFLSYTNPSDPSNYDNSTSNAKLTYSNVFYGKYVVVENYLNVQQTLKWYAWE